MLFIIFIFVLPFFDFIFLLHIFYKPSYNFNVKSRDSVTIFSKNKRYVLGEHRSFATSAICRKEGKNGKDNSWNELKIILFHLFILVVGFLLSIGLLRSFIPATSINSILAMLHLNITWYSAMLLYTFILPEGDIPFKTVRETFLVCLLTSLILTSLLFALVFKSIFI